MKAIAPVARLTRKFVDRNAGYSLAFDNSRSRDELELAYRPVDQIVTEHFQQMLDEGLVPRRPGAL